MEQLQITTLSKPKETVVRKKEKRKLPLMTVNQIQSSKPKAPVSMS